MKMNGKTKRKARSFFSSLSNHKCGVAILCTNNQNKLKAIYKNLCQAGRHLSIKIETELLSFTITNIYTPKIPRKRKKKKLETYIQNNTNNNLARDFNMVEDILKDRTGENLTTQHYGIENINNNKNNNNMIDIWQKIKPKKERIYL